MDRPSVYHSADTLKHRERQTHVDTGVMCKHHIDRPQLDSNPGASCSETAGPTTEQHH